MPGALENPLVEQCRELTEKVSKGWTDGQYAASVLIREAREMANALRPDARREFLAGVADQVEEASRAAEDTEVFEIFARSLRAEAARDEA